MFTAGQRVQVQNLVKAQEYNGLIGTVLGAAEGGRVGVKLDQVMFVEGSSAIFLSSTVVAAFPTTKVIAVMYSDSMRTGQGKELSLRAESLHLLECSTCSVVQDHAPGEGDRARKARRHMVSSRLKQLTAARDWAGVLLLQDEVRSALVGCDDVATSTFALQQLALAHGQVGDSLKAAELLEEVDRIFGSSGEIRGQMSCWNSLASVHARARPPRLAEAAKWTQKLMDQLDKDGNYDSMCSHGVFIGNHLVQAGGTEECALAVPFLERALAASEKSDDPSAVRMQALACLGTAYMDLGEFDKALSAASKSVEDMEALGDAGGMCGAYRSRAMIHERRGVQIDALADLQKMLQILVPGCTGLSESMRVQLVAEAETQIRRLRAM